MLDKTDEMINNKMSKVDKVKDCYRWDAKQILAWKTMVIHVIHAHRLENQDLTDDKKNLSQVHKRMSMHSTWSNVLSI
jgi:hypothetical protein